MGLHTVVHKGGGKGRRRKEEDKSPDFQGSTGIPKSNMHIKTSNGEGNVLLLDTKYLPSDIVQLHYHMVLPLENQLLHKLTLKSISYSAARTNR